MDWITAVWERLNFLKMHFARSRVNWNGEKNIIRKGKENERSENFLITPQINC